MTVFISYKSEDRGAVEDIVGGLGHENIDIWWDQGIAPSADWRAEIARQLHAAQVVVVVWSRNSVDLEDGRWVIQEAEDADARGVLVPVRIDDVLPPLGMRHRQAIDLIDWRGDRQDARWRGFVETVQAMLEGRPIDAQIARDTGPRTVGAMLRGRWAQLILALGLAALVITSAIAFGPLLAASLVIGLLLVYAMLNLFFGRRRNDRAAATFLRRAFAVGWITTLANVVIWLAAIGAGAYPYARSAFYEDFSIAVYDELRKPVPDAQVTVAFGERHRRVALGADGVGRTEYPLYWGPREAAVSVRHKNYEYKRPIQRDGARFGDLILGIPSGVERFRVRHLTLDELAIDSFHQGLTPRDIADIVPGIVGVIRNPVWEETEAYLKLYNSMGPRGSYFGTQFEPPSARSDGGRAAHNPSSGQSRRESEEEERRIQKLRWPRELSVLVPMDFSRGVFGCPIDKPLDSNYQLSLGDYDNYYIHDWLKPNEAATAALKSKGFDRFLKDGKIKAGLACLVDHQWVQQLIDSESIAEELAPEILGYLRFMLKRSIPAGVIRAEVYLFPVAACGLDAVGVKLTLPPAALRVSIIENVSDTPLPITSVVQGVAQRDRIETWVQGAVDASAITPWPGGTLAPGKAIAVPRRLIIQHALSEKAVLDWRASAEGPLLSFQVVARPEELRGWSPSITDPILRAASRGITLRTGQVVVDSSSFKEEPPHAIPPYVIGPSVENLALRMNDVDFEMRDDAGMVFAMMGGYEFGSCPFVYASAPEDGVLRNRGQIITDHVDAKAEDIDRLYLGAAVGRIEIRELEAEVSRLNQVRLIIQSGDGRERIYYPDRPELSRRDGQYFTLRQGETLALEFPGYKPQLHDRAVFLEVVGFYTPLPAPYRDQIKFHRMNGSR